MLKETRATLFTANATAAWLALSYVGPSTVSLTGGGENLQDMTDQFQDDQIQYGLVRLRFQNKATAKEENRDVFVAFVGPSVSQATKDKASSVLADAQALLQPFQASVTVTNRGRCNSDNLLMASAPGGTGVLA